MLTVRQLCEIMAASGRSLTPRTARSWWSKGFLPLPQRRWRRRESETFWTEPDIVERAQATFDLLRTCRRAGFVIEYLWLGDFAIEPRLVRDAYIRGIERHRRAAHTGRVARSRKRGDGPGDAIGVLAEQLARRNTAESAPAPAKLADDDHTLDPSRAYLAIVEDFLQRFYATGEEPECGDVLVTLYETAAPYFPSGPSGWSGDLLVSCAEFFGQKASLPALREAVASASDHDLTRVRRLVRLIWGFLGRLCSAVPEAARLIEDEVYVRGVQESLRMMVPLMVVWLSDKEIRQSIVDFIRPAGGSARWKAWLRDGAPWQPAAVATVDLNRQQGPPAEAARQVGAQDVVSKRTGSPYSGVIRDGVLLSVG